jgi:hypothetical protein
LLCWTITPGSAKITALVCCCPFGSFSVTIARRNEKPKSPLGGGWRWMVSSRGFGRGTGTTGGNGNSAEESSRPPEEYRFQRLWKPTKPWLSPTGLKLKGGVAKLLFVVVVSVRLSALGLVLVTVRSLLLVSAFVPAAIGAVR